MTEYILTGPVTVTESLVEAREFVVAQNLDLLKTQYNLLVDPNACFTVEVCDALTEAGILTKHESFYTKPPTEPGGAPTMVPMFITLEGVKIKLFTYAWVNKDMNQPSQFLLNAPAEILKQVCWDLRTFPGFCNVVVNG